jgi:hypothetical protein
VKEDLAALDKLPENKYQTDNTTHLMNTISSKPDFSKKIKEKIGFTYSCYSIFHFQNQKYKLDNLLLLKNGQVVQLCDIINWKKSSLSSV